MGEGEGAKDVSDQIEDEDQLLGAQQKGQEDQQVPVTTMSNACSCKPLTLGLKLPASMLIGPFFVVLELGL